MADDLCQAGSILVVAPSRQICSDFKKVLEEQGFTVCCSAWSLNAANRHITRRRPDLAVVDAALLSDNGPSAAGCDEFFDHDLPIVLAVARQQGGEKGHHIPHGTAIVGVLSMPLDANELAMLVTLGLARHQIERRILHAKREWEQAVDTIHDTIFLSDSTFTVTRANKKLADTLGLSYQQIIGSKCYELLHKSGAPPDDCLRLAMGEEGVAAYCERRVERLDGLFQITCYRFSGIQGNGTGFVHILRDITEQKRKEDRLREDLSCLQGVLDGLADAVMVISPDFRLIMSNRAAKSQKVGDAKPCLFCYELSHGRDTPCHDEDHRCPLEEVRTTGRAVTVVHHHVHNTAGSYPVEITATPLFDASGEFSGVIESARDITERLRLEQEREVLSRRLFDQQKKEAVCRLTSGIAHQYNNLLMRMVGNAELLRMKAPNAPEIERHTGQLLEAAALMAELTRKMMVYTAAGDSMQAEKLEVNKWIDNVLSLTWHERDATIQVVQDLAPGLPPVLADEKKLSQLLVALVSNACEAMADKGGRLLVSTRKKVKKREWQCRNGFAMPAGVYIELVVSDSGHGIASRDLPHIFDPFFTTRFLGRGLGLAMVDNIARLHGGCVAVTTDATQGTSFSVFLPAMGADKMSEQTGVSQAASVPLPSPPPHRLLVVDDEPDYLQIVSGYLADQGFSTRPVSTGEEALRSIAERPDAYDLVLLDIQLADVSGREVYRRIKKMSAKLPVLVISGFDRQTALEGMQFADSDGFLQKPFGLEELLAVIRGFGGCPGESPA